MENPFSLLETRLLNIEKRLIQVLQYCESSTTDEYLNVDEVARILRVSKQSVYAYIKKGEIDAKKVGRTYLILRSDLDKATKDVKSLKYRRAK